MKKRSLSILVLLCLSILTVKAQYLQKGFWGGVEMGYGLTVSDKGGAYHNKFGGDTKMQLFDLRSVFGYYITRSFSIGTGVGLATYSEPRINMIPIFIDFRYHPTASVNENFYLNFNIGTALASNQKQMDPKVLGELAVGYKLFDLGNFTLAPSFGYGYFRYKTEKFYGQNNEVLLEKNQKKRSFFFRLSLTY